MKNFWFLLGCTLLLVSACTPQPAPVITLAEAPAAVTSVEALKIVSAPVQVRVYVKGILPGACYLVGPEVVNSDGNNFVISLQAKPVSGATCAQAPASFERVVSLDLSKRTPGSYSVEVNGVRASFQLSAAELGQASPTPVSAASNPTNEPSPSPTATPLPASPEKTVAAPTATPVAAATQESCFNQLIFLADVTVPDFTTFSPGKAFTKTWSVQNVGSCVWDSAYSLAFLNGEQMSGPDHIPLPTAKPGDTVNVSVDLTAPQAGGGYTSNWQFLDPGGQRVAIRDNSANYIWLKINVAAPSPTPDLTATISATSPVPTGCTAIPDESFNQAIINLINQERDSYGLSKLTANSQLSAAAADHSLDMACHNFADHPGSDGSSWETRVRRRGYNFSYMSENVAGGSRANGATPDWVMKAIWADATHQANILSLNVTELGVSYIFNPATGWGYVTVDFARPVK